jgi:hypothetical protein
MGTLTYEKTDIVTQQKSIIEVPIKDAIREPITFANSDSTFRLLSSALPAYLVHRYAPMLHCSVNNTEKTYAEMYNESPEELIIYIKHNNLLDALDNDIQDMYRQYDALEIQVKQLDDYQNGRLNY